MIRRLFALALLGLCVLPMGWTAPDVQATLDDDAGWTFVKVSDGVSVYTKPVPGAPVAGFKGVLVSDVSPDAVFDAIADLELRARLNDLVADSGVVADKGSYRVLYEVMKMPAWARTMGMSDRYWFVKVERFRNINGEQGHHKQRFSRVDGSEFPEVAAQIEARHPGVVETVFNQGSWEVLPEPPGGSTLIWRIASHPGGDFSASMAEAVTSRSLPRNLNNFVNAGREMASR